MVELAKPPGIPPANEKSIKVLHIDSGLLFGNKHVLSSSFLHGQARVYYDT